MFTIGGETEKRTNECYEELEDAEIAAIEASVDDHVWFVRDDDGEIISLVFQMQVYRE